MCYKPYVTTMTQAEVKAAVREIRALTVMHRAMARGEGGLALRLTGGLPNLAEMLLVEHKGALAERLLDAGHGGAL